MKRDATLSNDGLYRYDLIRAVQPGCTCNRCYAQQFAATNVSFDSYVLWVLANPSIAGKEIDDATERRGWGFTSAWGYHQMRFVNVNPYRSTDPKAVKTPPDSVLILNEAYIKRHAHAAALIVCAWGDSADPKLARRTEEALRMVAPPDTLRAFGFTMKGAPKHPLYLSGDSMLKRWTP